jgi:hypothetical protein
VFSVQLGNGEHRTDVLVYSIVGMFVYWYSVLYSFVFSVQLGNGEHRTDVRVSSIVGMFVYWYSVLYV